MGINDEKSSGMMCCASCRIAAVDDIKLKDCDGGCGLVKYCSDRCQENYRAWHMIACKERAAELRERDLFTMPDESHLGDCPICCLPLPLDPQKSILMSCCSQSICDGCQYVNTKREYEAGLQRRCAFCREPLSKSEEEVDKRRMKRIKKNDPVAMRCMGKKHQCEGDYKAALKYWTKAAELGDADAHYNLSVSMMKGKVLRRTRKRQFIIWKRRQLQVTLMRGTILDV
jgi:hypothetical protein